MNEKGQIIIISVFLILVIFAGLILVIGVGYTIQQRIAMQKAVDAAALSAAVWQARGLNVISSLNYALIAAIGTDIIKSILSGDINNELSRAVKYAQDITAKTIPGAAGLGYRQIFNENMKGARCYPDPTALGKMFSLKVKRKKIDLWILGEYELWMEKDMDYWRNQKEKGPFIRLFAEKGKQKFPIGSNFLNLFIPRIFVVSQAMPYCKDGEGELGWLGGGLWNPRFNAKLVRITSSIPGINEIILH
jgi:hypothetical protein